MSLSRGKINHLSQIILGELNQAEFVELLKEPNELRLDVVRAISDGLKIEEMIDADVRQTLNSYSRKVVEGSREWDVMYQKLYEEELNKRIHLS